MSFSAPGVTEMFHFTPSRFNWTMNSSNDNPVLPELGCPIRKSPDQRLLAAVPRLIAASCVLLRLLAPRHSPYALSSLITKLTSSHLQSAPYPFEHGTPHRCAEALSEHCNFIALFTMCSCQRTSRTSPSPRRLTPDQVRSGKSFCRLRSVLKDRSTFTWHASSRNFPAEGTGNLMVFGFLSKRFLRKFSTPKISLPFSRGTGM